MIEISYQLGVDLLINPTRPRIDSKIQMIHRRVIWLIVESSLGALFKPNSSYGLYVRSNELDELSNNPNYPMEYMDLAELELTIHEFIEGRIKVDGHQGYGVYGVVEYRRGLNLGLGLVLEGDYRIMEWEAGRGRPPIDDDSDEMERVIDHQYRQHMERRRQLRASFELGEHLTHKDLADLADSYPDLNLTHL